MLGKLALKRTNVRFTHLTALAVMAALVVGLFGLMGSASAQAETIVKVTKTVATDADPPVTSPVTITASDKDGVVGDGERVDFIASVGDGNDDGDDDDTVTALTAVAIAPLPGSQGAANTVTDTAADISIGNGTPVVTGRVASVYFPAGTPDGEYTVTVTVDPGAAGDAGGAPVNFVFKLRNTDPGTALASASIGFGKYTAGSDADGTVGNDDDVVASCAAPAPTEAANGDSAKYGTPICLMVTALNSLGNPAQDEDIKEIIVSAPTADVYAPKALATAPTTLVGKGENSKTFKADSTATPVTTSPGSTQYFLVDRPNAAGVVEVSVLVIGEGTAGFADAGSVTLMFTGDPATISLDEPSSPLAKDGRQSVREDEGHPGDDGNPGTDDTNEVDPVKGVTLVGATIKVMAEDSAGNNAVLAVDDLTSLTVADANGKATDKVKAIAKPLGTPEATTIEVWSEGASAGVYTLTVKLRTKDSAMVDVVVSGGAASVSLATEWDDDQTTLTATATVMDKDGNLVPNTTSVQFDAIGSLDLRARSGVGVVKDSDGKGAKVNTMNGVATLRFSPISESGTARIFASVVDAAADDVDTVSIEAATTEAMPEEEASVSCLSNLSGFSTWSCGVESSAVEIFGLVSGRGASAVHLWNGSEWVRYSVVEGAMVPGSSDFMVTEDDILYISN